MEILAWCLLLLLLLTEWLSKYCPPPSHYFPSLQQNIEARRPDAAAKLDSMVKFEELWHTGGGLGLWALLQPLTTDCLYPSPCPSFYDYSFKIYSIGAHVELTEQNVYRKFPGMNS